MRSDQEWKAYYEGRGDCDREQKRCPGSFVVVFEDHLSPDERNATAAAATTAGADDAPTRAESRRAATR